MIQDWPPAREIQLPFNQARESVVRRPAIQEISLFSQALAPGLHVATHKASCSKGEVNGVKLVSSVAAVLLALAGHAIHEGFLRTVIERIDAGIEQTLEGRLTASNLGRVGPWIETPAQPYVLQPHFPRPGWKCS
jgi:hypothetical protein